MFPCFLLLNRLERDGQPLNCPVDRDKLSRETVRKFFNAKHLWEEHVEVFNIYCLQKVTCEPNGCLWLFNGFACSLVSVIGKKKSSNISFKEI